VQCLGSQNLTYHNEELMKRIGIDQSFGDVYESVGNYWRTIWPTPMVSDAIFDPEIPARFTMSPRGCSHAFREDAFDPVARVRRGRFYELANEPQPVQAFALGHPAGEYPGAVKRVDGVYERFLHVYDQYRVSLDRTGPNLVALGSPESLWRVIGWERITTDEFVCTLKARHGHGILPEIDRQKIPEPGRAKAVETLEALMDAAHRESAGSIIDRARDAAQWCLGTWAASEFADTRLLHEDLGPLLGKVGKKKEMVAFKAAEIVARLHSRGKPNEQERRDLRPLMEADAELALNSVAFLVREFSWVKE
jgi:hypothetical protein